MSPIIQTLGNASAYGYRSFAADTGSFESIATVTVGSGGSSTITFSSIPSTYAHLQIRAISIVSSGNNLGMYFNTDSSSGNYSAHQLQGDGGGVGVLAGTSLNTMGYLGLYTSSSSYPAVSIIDILDYANTNKYKTIKVLTGQDGNGTGTPDDWRISLNSGNWRSTSAVSSLTISGPSFAQYSHFALYGIKSA